MTELLANYWGGRWQTGTAAGTVLRDPVLGTDLVRVDAHGLDLNAGFAFAREVGGAALRAMTYAQRGAMLAAVVQVLQNHREAYYEIATANSGTVKNDSAVRAAICSRKVSGVMAVSVVASVGLRRCGRSRLASDPKMQYCS